MAGADPPPPGATVHDPGRPAPRAPAEQALLSCLCCGRDTVHRPGPVTVGRDGTVLVRWWRCTECAEGQTIR